MSAERDVERAMKLVSSRFTNEQESKEVRDLLARLTAENERLVAALETIMNRDPYDLGYVQFVQFEAHRALKLATPDVASSPTNSGDGPVGNEGRDGVAFTPQADAAGAG